MLNNNRFLFIISVLCSLILTSCGKFSLGEEDSSYCEYCNTPQCIDADLCGVEFPENYTPIEHIENSSIDTYELFEGVELKNSNFFKNDINIVNKYKCDTLKKSIKIGKFSLIKGENNQYRYLYDILDSILERLKDDKITIEQMLTDNKNLIDFLVFKLRSIKYGIKNNFINNSKIISDVIQEFSNHVDSNKIRETHAEDYKKYRIENNVSMLRKVITAYLEHYEYYEHTLATEKLHYDENNSSKIDMNLMWMFSDFDFNKKTGTGSNIYSEKTYAQVIESWNRQGVIPTIWLWDKDNFILNPNLKNLNYKVANIEDLEFYKKIANYAITTKEHLAGSNKEVGKYNMYSILNALRMDILKNRATQECNK